MPNGPINLAQRHAEAAAFQLRIHTYAIRAGRVCRAVPPHLLLAIISLSVDRAFRGQDVTMRHLIRPILSLCSPATVRRHVARLEANGLLSGEGERPRRYRPTDMAARLLLESVGHGARTPLLRPGA